MYQLLLRALLRLILLNNRHSLVSRLNSGGYEFLLMMILADLKAYSSSKKTDVGGSP